ncbi:hypothetical protein IGB42_03661 [Andreprevotia sp. IGB-42]|uniref:OsmC family protein n=1 Tax=Andreprevotia sp. IGB-42 TaxID=2497473 RepID=UPI00135A622D|nr:OsmC family protein [Andreprevotia sp. IGB-42]KAF0811851.1 hypothetical protein IGB42_03661 [Andreprevotia sp. IGB-42]
MAYETVHARLDGAPYQVQVGDGTHDWLADVTAASGGGDSGPGPHAQLLAALGACTSITVKMYADRKGWALTDIRVTLRYADDHRDGDSKLERVIELHGDLDAAQRQRLLEIANACPIHKLLSGPVAIHTALAA